MKQTTTPRLPVIAWEQDIVYDCFYCKVRVPHTWLMEVSNFKRRWLLWWWLTKLAWSLPK